MSKTKEPSKALIVTNFLPVYAAEVSPQWLKERSSLLENSFQIQTVTDQDEQVVAVEAASALKRFSAEVEAVREELKKPILAAGRLLDKTAKEATDEIKEEAARIESLLSGYYYQQEQERRRIIAAQEAAARKAREAAAAAEKAEQERLAEIERKRLEAERQAIAARSKKAREAAAAEAAALKAEQDEALFESDFKPAVQIPVFVPPPEPVKPTGAQTRRKIAYRITDIAALYKAHPSCVTLELNKTQLNYLLATPGLDLRDIPGVEAWEEYTTSALK